MSHMDADTIDYGQDAPHLDPAARPKADRAKFNAVFLYLISKYQDVECVGRTALHKLLYFIDFDHYELHGEPLMGLEYIHHDHGPFATKFNDWTRALVKSGAVKPVSTPAGSGGRDYPTNRYIPIGKPPCTLTERERQHIDRVLTRLAPHNPDQLNATRLRAISHKEVPWRDTPQGEVIEYPLAYHRTDDTAQAVYEDE